MAAAWRQALCVDMRSSSSQRRFSAVGRPHSKHACTSAGPLRLPKGYHGSGNNTPHPPACGGKRRGARQPTVPRRQRPERCVCLLCMLRAWPQCARQVAACPKSMLAAIVMKGDLQPHIAVGVEVHTAVKTQCFGGCCFTAASYCIADLAGCHQPVQLLKSTAGAGLARACCPHSSG